MTAKLRTRIARAVNDALLERDRTEMRAVDALLSLVASPRRRRSNAGRRAKAKRRPR